MFEANLEVGRSNFFSVKNELDANDNLSHG